MIHWLQHCGSWFGFTEPARFQAHQKGGYFVSVASGEQIVSIVHNGFRNPERGLAPWAAPSCEFPACGGDAEVCRRCRVPDLDDAVVMGGGHGN